VSGVCLNKVLSQSFVELPEIYNVWPLQVVSDSDPVALATPSILSGVDYVFIDDLVFD
jgi:hypothetical protein